MWKAAIWAAAQMFLKADVIFFNSEKQVVEEHAGPESGLHWSPSAPGSEAPRQG